MESLGARPTNSHDTWFQGRDQFVLDEFKTYVSTHAKGSLTAFHKLHQDVRNFPPYNSLQKQLRSHISQCESLAVGSTEVLPSHPAFAGLVEKSMSEYYSKSDFRSDAFLKFLELFVVWKTQTVSTSVKVIATKLAEDFEGNLDASVGKWYEVAENVWSEWELGQDHMAFDSSKTGKNIPLGMELVVEKPSSLSAPVRSVDKNLPSWRGLSDRDLEFLAQNCGSFKFSRTTRMYHMYRNEALAQMELPWPAKVVEIPFSRELLKEMQNSFLHVVQRIMSDELSSTPPTPKGKYPYNYIVCSDPEMVPRVAVDRTDPLFIRWMKLLYKSYGGKGTKDRNVVHGKRSDKGTTTGLQRKRFLSTKSNTCRTPFCYGKMDTGYLMESCQLEMYHANADYISNSSSGKAICKITRLSKQEILYCGWFVHFSLLLEFMKSYTV